MFFDEDLPHPILAHFLPQIVPADVFQEIPAEFAGIENFLPDFVADELPPVPQLIHQSVDKDGFLRYKDRVIETQFLMWESRYGKNRMIVAAICIFLAFLLHLWICAENADDQWACGDMTAFILATLLIWIPPIGVLMPFPYSYQYKEAINALHQVLTGLLLSHFLRLRILNSSNVFKTPQIGLSCSLPLIVESVLFGVRMHLHYVLNAVMIALLVCHFYTNDKIDVEPIDCIVNLIAAVVVPACSQILIQKWLREKFEAEYMGF